MPDPSATKENDYPVKGKNNSKLDRSPVRRKHQTNESTAVSPNKERAYKSDQDFTKPSFSSPYTEVLKNKKDNGKSSELMTPGSFLPYNPKLATTSPKQVHSAPYYEVPIKNSPSSKDCLSTSPTASGRWAGPAFGNAPHPSTLPLPEFPPMASLPIPTSRPQESYLSNSPPGRDRDPYHGMVYQPPSTPPHFVSQSPPSGHLSSIPVVPFPYVGHAMPATPSLSLAQLSTDLRRMLNINDIPSPIARDPILVSANSS